MDDSQKQVGFEGSVEELVDIQLKYGADAGELARIRRKWIAADVFLNTTVLWAVITAIRLNESSFLEKILTALACVAAGAISIPVSAKRYIRKNRRDAIRMTQAQLNGRDSISYKYAIDDSGLTAQIDNATISLPWRDLDFVRTTDEGIHIKFRSAWMVLPRRIFADEVHLNAYISEVKRFAGVS